jgi:phenylacetate-CoA ligase
VEIVDANGDDVPPGQMGRVLATRLDNFAMPLIRYELGDLVELEKDNAGPCECGRELPLLRRLIGRDTDIVVTRSGKRMIVHFFTGIFEHVPEIRQFKVVQRNLDEIEIHFVRNGHFNRQVIETVQSRIHGHLKEKFPIRWVETDRISPTNSGKPQIIQSFLNRSRLPGAHVKECGLSS